MKKILFLSVLIVFFITSFIFLVGCSDDKKSDNRKVIYQLQKQCGEDSKEFYKGNYTESIHYKSMFTSYHNHYNENLNKCFILVDVINERYSKTYLYDVNENNYPYGRLEIIIEKDGRIQTCSVKKKQCKSEDEWNSLIKPYMEE